MRLKKTFVQGKMNMDIDERLLPEGQYPYAENIRVAETDSANLGALQNLKGNHQLTSFNLTNAMTIGGYADSANQKIYWFITSDEKDMVVEYDFRNYISSILLESTAKTGVLKFDKSYLITGVIKIINGDSRKDLLVWTDDLNPPRVINIERAKTYGFNGFDEEDISLIKKPPRFSPKIQLTYTDTSLENNLEDKFISFAYRYRYLDGEYSALSSFTNYSFAPEKFDLDYQSMENNGMKNAFNAVNIFFNTGDKRVTDIELVFKQTNSNTLYLIQRFSKEKEMWGNDEERSFKFSNSKRYKTLADDELYRVYDNVPLQAKALEIIGNRLVFGNYTEGYDLVNIFGEEINVDYNVSLLNKSLTGSQLPVSFSSNKQQMIIDLSNIVLKEGSKLSFTINLKESTYDKGKFEGNFDFIFNKTYQSVSELVSDADFVFFVENIMTNNFMQNYTATAPDNSSIQSNTKFLINFVSGNTFSLTTPKIVYLIDDTPTNTTDNPANTHIETSNWDYQNTSNVYFNEISVSSSLKTNRSYEVGIVYMDSANRSTPVLTCANNTIYVPQEFSTSQNKLVINVNHLPPVWADRYKFAVKQNKGDYQTIYTNIFYQDGLYRWVLLEGANKDKVKEGDILIVKSDLSGVLPSLVKTRVLEIAVKNKDFIEDNKDADDNDIVEEAGLYMKIKPLGFDMTFDKATVRTFTGNQGLRYVTRCYTNPYFGETTNGSFQPYKLKSGSRIRIFIRIHAGGKIAFDGIYDKRFRVQGNYNSVKEWFESEVQTLGQFATDYVAEYGFTGGGEQFYIKANRDGTASRRIFTEIRWELFFSDGDVVFETEAADIDSEIFYESSQTFEIVNNKHNGNIQNQDNISPAIVELDTFNCYVQGNGAESYRYKDDFNSNFLNIDLRPSSTMVEKYKRVRRYADLTYSEPYVENNNLNGLNEFNLSRANYKEDIDKKYGYIQKLHSRDTDLLVFQEDKVSKVLFGKDTLMNTDGTYNLSSIRDVLGHQVMYAGEYGISRNPESFAYDGHYIYFTDSKRGAVMRLAGDGLNEVSSLGLRQFFKDKFKTAIDNKKIGGYDPYFDEYVIHQSVEEKVLPINTSCSNNIIKNNFSGQFVIYMDFGSVTGECGFSYVTNGKPISLTFIWNGQVYNENLNSTGTFTFNKTDKEPIGKIIINANDCGSNISINGICPVSYQGTVFFVVTNTSYYEGKNYYNRYKSVEGNYSSPFKSNEGIFNQGEVTLFEKISGSKGQGFIPNDNSNVILETYYTSQQTPIFKNGGKFAYLVSNTEYTSSDIDLIKQSMINIPHDEIINANGDIIYRGNFGLSNYQYLYLIYDYSSPPVANDDKINVERGYSVTSDLRINDSDINSLPLSVIIKSNPVYGTVVVNNDGTITYTHDGSTMTDSDIFTYSVTNGNSESNIAKVFINIIDTPPVANDDSAFLQNGSNVIIDVKQNDVDSYSRPLSVHIVTNPTYGTVVVNNDGTITYTHDGSTSTADSFTYKVNNGILDSNIANVNITIGEIFTFDADYAVITYEFTDGMDLDIRTRIVTPDISMNTYLGYAKSFCFPSDSSWSQTNIPMNAVMDWSGDNTGTGFESILIDINKLKQQVPLITNLAVDLRCGWWNTLGNSPVNVKAIFYKGGQMIKGAQPYQYSNPTAVSSLEVTSASKQISMMFGGNGALIGDRLGVFKYDTHTHIGYFDMNDVITPTV